MQIYNIFITVLLVRFSCQQSAPSINPNSALFTEIFSYHAETNDKADFALQVVNKIFTSFRQWFYTVIFCEFTYFENRILKYIESRYYSYPVLLLNSCPSSDKTRVKPKIDKQGSTTYIVTSNEISLELNDQVIQVLLRTGVFKPRSIVVFVINVPVEMDSYFYYTIKVHFQLLWSRKITNSVLIVYADKLRVYAYNPFFDNVMDVTNVKNLARLLRRVYYNLHGHTLRLSVFRKIYVSDETGPLLCNSNLASTVMNRFNATCEPLPPRDGSTVGDLLDNGTATGVTRDLLDGYTDLELNSRILKNTYYGYIDTTYPLTQDELCFLVKKAGRQTSFWTTIKLISLPMLIFLIFNVLFFMIIGVCIQKQEAKILGLRSRSDSSTMMDLIKCMLKQTYDVKFLGTSFRFAVLMVMIYSLIVNAVIESIITSAITYPRYKPDINTLNELMHSNLTLGIHNRHMNIYKSSMTEDQYQNLANRLEVFNDKKIKQVITERQFQYAVLLRKSDSLAISRKVANMHDGRPLFHTVAECPIPCSIVYGLRYGSPYAPRLDNILIYLSQAGILQHWVKTEELSLTSNLGKILNSADDSKMKRKLNAENLQEIFFVWLIGLLVSAFVFTFEMLSRTIFQRALLV